MPGQPNSLRPPPPLVQILRNNPLAKTDLKQRVNAFIHDKAEEHSERVAVAEFAAERREQKVDGC
jgi:hypothetical protein